VVTASVRSGRRTPRVSNGHAEIQLGENARKQVPVIAERDDPDYQGRGGFDGRLYCWWTYHRSDGGCDRDPRDPHEDLLYGGQTTRLLWMRWAEHLTGKPKPTAVTPYARRGEITGVSVLPQHYRSQTSLDLAEDALIKAGWPIANIQDQDRRNPATRATRGYRRPDRLAPVISVWFALIAVLWVAASVGAALVLTAGGAPLWAVICTPAEVAVMFAVVRAWGVRSHARTRRRLSR
jgi:hypothetical protein